MGQIRTKQTTSLMLYGLPKLVILLSPSGGERPRISSHVRDKDPSHDLIGGLRLSEKVLVYRRADRLRLACLEYLRPNKFARCQATR